MDDNKVTEIQEYVDLVHKIAIDKGWWDIDRSPLEIHALIHSEISEAVEEARKGIFACGYAIENDGKPIGEAVELVDAVIRIMDYFGHKGWDLENVLNKKIEYNKNRSYRHGNKRY